MALSRTPKVYLSPEDRRRVRDAARALGTSYSEFCGFAIMQAVSEVEAADNELRLRKALSRSPFTQRPEPEEGE